MRIHIANLARRIALRKRKDASKFRHAAVYVQGAAVYSFGINTTRPGNYPNSTHAEVACLHKIPMVTSGDLYVCRVLANGNLAMSRPCPSCMEYIKSRGIDTVHYSNQNGGWTSIELRHEK